MRTMAGWVGVEIGKSRVRTPGKAGYGLYRVRGSVGHRTRGELDGLTPGALTPDDMGERAPWTPYAFTLEQVRAAVVGAIERGTPAGPDVLSLQVWPDLTPTYAVLTRWTSAYRGRRDLGVGKCGNGGKAWPFHAGPVTVDDVRGDWPAVEFECLDVTEPDGVICHGTVHVEMGAPDGPCDECGGRCGRHAPGVSERSTVRARQRAANAAFQAEHKPARDAGLRARHAAKLSRQQP